ncbi:MAG: hypothetical protein ABI651_19820 [Verrucomicrobiota bacterium]
MIARSYQKAIGLTETDPPELLQFALSRSEPRTEPLTPEELKRSKDFGDHIRKHDPTFDADKTYQPGQQFLAKLGDVTLRNTAERLAARAKDDAELARWLSKLLNIYKCPLVKSDEYRRARGDDDSTTRLLLQHWIQDPPRETWAKASLCFYSDRAMAEMIYFLRYNKPLPATLKTKEPERIRKLYCKLQLMPASPRLIKDVEFRAGEPGFVFFKKAIHKD